MPRVSGVDIPPDKKIKISLRYIYGVGPSNALDILKEAAIDPERRAKDLSEEDLAKIIGIIDKDLLVEGALRRKVQQDVARLRDIGSSRGHRREPSASKARARARRSPPVAPPKRPPPKRASTECWKSK